MNFKCLLILIIIQECLCDQISKRFRKGEYASRRVINGWPATNSAQVPYLVSFKTRTRNVLQGKPLYGNFCGGSIISRDRVLSAAHCFVVDAGYFSKLFGIRHNIVRLDSFAVAGNLFTVSVRPNYDHATLGQWRLLETVKFPETFDFPNDDLAVVYLSWPFEFNKFVDSIPYPSRKFVDYRGSCLISGFGRVDGTYISARLMLGHVKLESKFVCNLRRRQSSHKLICGSVTFASSAKGDSGGPLVCQTKDPQGRQIGRHGELIGVVSGGNDYGTVYTRLSAYSDYIKRGSCDRPNGNKALLLFLLYALGDRF